MSPAQYSVRKITNLPASAASLLALALSLLTSAALVFVTRLEHVNNTSIALIFLLPVGLSATLWGLVPGIVAASVSFLAFNFFFIPNLYTFEVKQTEDLIVLAAFLGVAMVISEFAGRVRRNLELATEREHEAIRLYEFSSMLAAATEENAIAKILLEIIDQTLHPEHIEILIEAMPKAIFIAKGNLLPHHRLQKAYILPLQTTQNLMGEIRVWSQQGIRETDERMLKVFTNQSVLAVERIRLADAVRQTRVLEESDRLKSSLLSSVSHELRSPLAAIKASVSSLRTAEVAWDSEARTELLTTVEEEIDHLNMLVGNLLDMSRIEAGALKPNKKPNILTEILGTVTGRLLPQTQNHLIVVQVSDDLPLINVDYVQIQQVFTNLLTNSLKYSPPGSEIRISASQQNAQFILVSLTNRSMPVPETDLERIFNKFYRINPSDQVTGAGLGLSICKGIIEAHGGKIWAENLNNGLAFNFTLPIKETNP